MPFASIAQWLAHWVGIPRVRSSIPGQADREILLDQEEEVDWHLPFNIDFMAWITFLAPLEMIKDNRRGLLTSRKKGTINIRPQCLKLRLSRGRRVTPYALSFK